MQNSKAFLFLLYFVLSKEFIDTIYKSFVCTLVEDENLHFLFEAS